MEHYSQAAVERAMSKEIAWFQAAEIIGISPRQIAALEGSLGEARL